VQAAEQADQDRTAIEIVVERDLALSIDRGQREVGGGITGAKGRERHEQGHLSIRVVFGGEAIVAGNDRGGSSATSTSSAR
jgi:hypothetical protein